MTTHRPFCNLKHCGASEQSLHYLKYSSEDKQHYRYEERDVVKLSLNEMWRNCFKQKSND